MSNGNGLPQGWVCRAMSEVCQKIQDGTHFSPKEDRQFPTGPFPYITAKNVRPWGLDLCKLTYLLEEDHRLIYERCNPVKGDVLLVKDGVNAGDAAINTVDGEVSLLSSVCMLRPKDAVLLSGFLRYFLLSPAGYRLLTGQMTGTAIKRIILQRIRETQVPVAPLNEQRRIVAKIEELFSDLDAGVAALERAKAKLKRYRAAVLKAAVEGKLTEQWRAEHPPKETAADLLKRILKERRCRWEQEQLAAYQKAGKKPPANWQQKYKEPAAPDEASLPALPEGWCWASVEQVISYLRNGLSQKPSQVPPGYRILRINAVRPMSVDLEEARYYDKPEKEVSDYFLKDGDLLFTRYNGSVDLLGVVGMVRGLTAPTLHPDKLICVRGVLSHPLPEYLEIVGNIGVSRQHMQGRARTTAGQTGISGNDVREMPIPLCCLAEQEQIIQEVEQRLSLLEEAAAQIDADLKRSARLRQSILKRAFEGKLVPQHPEDGAACVLLERIKSGQGIAEYVSRDRRKGRNAEPRHGNR